MRQNHELNAIDLNNLAHYLINTISDIGTCAPSAYNKAFISIISIQSTLFMNVIKNFKLEIKIHTLPCLASTSLSLCSNELNGISVLINNY